MGTIVLLVVIVLVVAVVVYTIQYSKKKDNVVVPNNDVTESGQQNNWCEGWQLVAIPTGETTGDSKSASKDKHSIFALCLVYDGTPERDCKANVDVKYQWYDGVLHYQDYQGTPIVSAEKKITVGKQSFYGCNLIAAPNLSIKEIRNFKVTNK